MKRFLEHLITDNCNPPEKNAKSLNEELKDNAK